MRYTIGIYTDTDIGFLAVYRADAMFHFESVCFI